ncbi:hypothetical protein NMY22_g5332 [Coprinellus aureogranulatus]|nr:hypothetical protein NMY22_g5332 [Coprinellus aureogranulatus]
MPCLRVSSPLRKFHWFRAKRRRPFNDPVPPSRSSPLHDEPQHAAASAPYELLHIIFSLAMTPSSSDIDYSEKALLRSTISSISQVCARWRHTALSDSYLWAHSVDFGRHSPKAIAFFLSLSRPHPIDVGHRSAPFRVYGERGVAVLRAMREDFYRVAQWNIDVSPEFRFNGVQTLFGNPDNDMSPYPVQTLRLAGIMNLPVRDWQRMASSLQRLSLCDTNIVLTPSLDLSNLTELAITTVYRSVKYQIAEVLAVLRKTPQLQLLSLKDAIAPVRDPIAANQFNPVHLPELRFVAGEESQWQTACLLLALLSFIQRPLQCGLDISLPSGNAPWFNSSEYLFGRALKVTGDQTRQEDYETWLSPIVGVFA